MQFFVNDLCIYFLFTITDYTELSTTSVTQVQLVHIIICVIE